MDRSVKCPVCDRERFAFVWTDKHGVGACIQCNSSFLIYHYDDDKNIIEGMLPECIISDDWIPLLRRYWQEQKRPIPNCFVFTTTYDQCSDDDHRAWADWCEEHKAELPHKEVE